MRHRSHIAFILLAAALFAAPQVSHDLSTLRGALAARIRGEILQAFLGLHAGESNGGAAVQVPARRAELALASCPASKSAGTEGHGAPAKAAPRAAQRAEAERHAGERSELAMLGNPDDKTNAGLPPAADFAELASLRREGAGELRLAMLTQPGNGVEPPTPAVALALRNAPVAKLDAAAREKFAEMERHAVFVQASLDGEAEWVRRAASAAARAAEDGEKMKTRVLKLRRPARACPGALTTPAVAPAPRPEIPVQVTIGE